MRPPLSWEYLLWFVPVLVTPVRDDAIKFSSPLPALHVFHLVVGILPSAGDRSCFCSLESLRFASLASLVGLGTLVGRSFSKQGDFPCRVNSLERPIPDGKWYTRPLAMAFFTGLLPFGSIFIEM